MQVRINEPVAKLLEDEDRLELIKKDLDRNMSIYYIAKKYGISKYSAKRLREILK